MGKVINLKIFRHGTGRHAAQGEGARMWGCSVCAGHTWTLSTAAEIRCATCGSAAGNLAAIETSQPLAATH